jgi:hypothetical protein
MHDSSLSIHVLRTTKKKKKKSFLSSFCWSRFNKEALIIAVLTKTAQYGAA